MKKYLLLIMLLILSASASANILYFQDYRTATHFDGNVTNTSSRTVFNNLGLNFTSASASEYLKINPATFGTTGPAKNCSGMIVNFSSGTGAALHFLGVSASIQATVQPSSSGMQIDGASPDWYPALFGASLGGNVMPKPNNYSFFMSMCYNSTQTANITIFNSTQSGGVYGEYTQFKSSINAISNDLQMFYTVNAGPQIVQFYNWLAWNETFYPVAPTPPPPAPSAGSIIAADRYDSVNISVFNVSLTNTTGTFRFNTTNGTVSPGIAGNFTINFTRGDYFLFSNFSEINGTSIINLTPWQAVINLNLSEIITGTELSINGNNVTTFNGQSSNRTLYVRAVGYNITARRAGYLTQTREFNAPTAVTNTTINFLNMYTTVLNITANHFFDSSIITTFNVTITNGTHSIFYNTTNGNIEAGVLNGTWSISINSSLALGANTTINAQNVTHKINFTLFSVWLDAYALEKVSNFTLSNFILFTPQFNNKNSSNTTIFLKSGRINVTLSKSPYFNRTVEFNFVNLGNLSFTFANMSYSTVNFSAKLNGINPVGNFTVNLTSKNNSFIYYQELLNASNFTVQANLINGSYKAIFTNRDNTTLLFSQVAIEFTVNDSFKNVNVSFKQIGVLGMDFKDEKTLFAVNFETISLEIIGSQFSGNFTTTNGTFSTPILVPDSYYVRYRSPSYAERLQRFTVFTNFSTDATLYMINNSISLNYTVTIVDQVGLPIEAAEVRLLRYFLPTNNYQMVESLLTDSEGKTIFHVQPLSEFYVWTVLVNNVVLKQTNPAQIKDLSYTIQVNTQGNAAQLLYTTLNISYAINFNTSNNVFTMSYNDPTGGLSNTCLGLKQKIALGDRIINTTCSTSSSAILNLAAPNISGATYEATAYATINNIPTYIASAQVELSTISAYGLLGVFLVWMLTLVFASTALWNPSVALIIAPIPLVLGSYASMISIDMQYAVGIWIVSIIGAYIISEAT